MSLEWVLFLVVAAGTAGSALGVVFARNVIRSAVWLLFTLVGVALTYFLLGAAFLGAAQLIVYVGGTLVLVVFGAMLTGGGPFQTMPAKRVEWVAGGVVAIGLFAGLAAVSLKLGEKITPPRADLDRLARGDVVTLPGKPSSRGLVPAPSEPGRSDVTTGELGLAFLGVHRTPTDANAPRTATDEAAYLLPFEVVSIHLLVVLVGAAYLARAKKRVRPAEAVK